MWTRSELKARAKTRFKANYWKCVLVAFILMLVSGGFSAGSNAKNASDTTESITIDFDHPEQALMELQELSNSPEVQAAMRVVRTMSLLMTVLGLLVFNPLVVGCKNFFRRNTAVEADTNELSVAFKPNWIRNVLGMFLRGLFTGLWALLFIIPGIVKAYSYRMVPYIMAEDPDIDALDAITKSRRMMNGHKWNTFVLDLSFLGWGILTVLTLGLAGIFYVFPYKEATEAELFQALKRENAEY